MSSFVTCPLGVCFFFCSPALNFLHAFLSEYDRLCRAQPSVRRSRKRPMGHSCLCGRGKRRLINAVLLFRDLTTILGRYVSSSSRPVFGFNHCESISDHPPSDALPQSTASRLRSNGALNATIKAPRWMAFQKTFFKNIERE